MKRLVAVADNQRYLHLNFASLE